MIEKCFSYGKNGVSVKIFEDTNGLMSGLQIKTYFHDHCVGDVELRNEEVRDIAKYVSEELEKQKERVANKQIQGGDLNE